MSFRLSNTSLVSYTIFNQVSIFFDQRRRNWHTHKRTASGAYTMRVTLEGGKVFSDKVVKE